MAFSFEHSCLETIADRIHPGGMNQAASAKSLPRSQGIILRSVDRRRLRLMLNEHGEAEALRILGLARQTFARLVAGLTVRRATAEMVSRRLAGDSADDPSTRRQRPIGATSTTASSKVGEQ
jgi:hypothetical protein